MGAGEMFGDGGVFSVVKRLRGYMSVAKLDKTWSVTATIGQTARLDGQVKAGLLLLFTDCPLFADQTRLIRAGDQRQGRSPVLAVLLPFDHDYSTINSSLNSVQTSMPPDLKTRTSTAPDAIGSQRRRRQCFHQHPHTGPAARRTTPPCHYATPIMQH